MCRVLARPVRGWSRDWSEDGSCTALPSSLCCHATQQVLGGYVHSYGWQWQVTGTGWFSLWNSWADSGATAAEKTTFADAVHEAWTGAFGVPAREASGWVNATTPAGFDPAPRLITMTLDGLGVLGNVRLGGWVCVRARVWVGGCVGR